jgi:hypothetical protein
MSRKAIFPPVSLIRKLEAASQKRHRARMAEDSHRESGVNGRPPMLIKEEKQFVLATIRQKLQEGNSVLISFIRQFVFLLCLFVSTFLLFCSIFFR